MNDILLKAEKELSRIFAGESSGHDLSHLKRVMRLAVLIQKEEGGNALVIALAALLHDIHRIISIENSKYCTPKQSLPQASVILNKLDIKEEIKIKVLHCIEFHEEYSFGIDGKTANDKETLIIQDADNLDAIGAVGIGRTFMYSGFHNIPMWMPGIPFYRNKFSEAVNDVSTLHHLHNKLLRLKDNMNTKTAKEIAKKRHLFMKAFIKEFIKEWNTKE